MKDFFRYRKLRITIAALLLILGTSYFAFADYYEDLSRQIRLFTELYKELVVNYVDQVNPEALVEAGITGMLETLDPYTVYLEEEDQHNIQSLTEGKYGGVGIRLGVRQDTLTVIAPIEGSPAMRAGIQAGDKIVQIDTVRTAEMRLSKAANYMRGEPGTNVTLTILRPGFEERIPFVLERASIEVHDLAYADYIGEDIAYLRLTSFSKNSDSELRKAFEDLTIENSSGLILDLRGNPGGLLTSALDVVELFVEPDVDVLSTKGRTDKSNNTFTTNREAVVPQDLPIAVLVDHGSASASEIVAGVLQDLDRAIILGKSTFGKGLVQTVVPLTRESAIKITTAKYYIPSGRLIQKQDYFNEDVIAEPTRDDSIFYTRNDRKVYGGGGITPDLTVKSDTMPRAVRSIAAGNHFFHFSVSYHNNHPDIAPSMEVSDSIYTAFLDYLDQKEFQYRTGAHKHFERFVSSLDTTELERPDIAGAVETFESHFASKEHWKDRKSSRDWITRILTRELAQVYGGTKARIRADLEHDNTLQTARQVLRDQSEYRAQLGFAVASTNGGE
ncbi:MAG: S41 family peptidase [Candidatus Marinimicrobia bacterium]|nr:S41 family peptidase [Candidatus Neomarinimicrobiota bacterium]MCF7828267.1 S41 family peptidase [Candidatus Neomarinimicrobiota bacterium]MCF7879558.1 S41 family peptidase [Candidatus Neomarinimicrobiota bacterium]